VENDKRMAGQDQGGDARALRLRRAGSMQIATDVPSARAGDAGSAPGHLVRANVANGVLASAKAVFGQVARATYICPATICAQTSIAHSQQDRGRSPRCVDDAR
jgi:hypothetical protein